MKFFTGSGWKGMVKIIEDDIARRVGNEEQHTSQRVNDLRAAHADALKRESDWSTVMLDQHQRDTSALMAAHDRAIEGWREVVRRQGEELSALRVMNGELLGTLVALKRDGFALPDPDRPAPSAAEFVLPQPVRDAIDAIAWDTGVTAHLEATAWQWLQQGVVESEIVRRIQTGEEGDTRAARDPDRPRTRIVAGRVVGEIPDDAPVTRHEEDAEDDE